MQAVFGGKFSSNLIDKIVKDVPYNHIMWCKISKNFNLCILKNNTDSYRQVKLANANAACMYCSLFPCRTVCFAHHVVEYRLVELACLVSKIVAHVDVACTLVHRHGRCLGCAVAIVGHYIGLSAFHVTFHALAQLLDYIGGHLAAVDYGCVAARALVNICYSLLHAGLALLLAQVFI